MLLEHLGHQDAADAIVAAFETVLTEGDSKVLTPYLGGQGMTEALGRAIAGRV